LSELLQITHTRIDSPTRGSIHPHANQITHTRIDSSTQAAQAAKAAAKKAAAAKPAKVEPAPVAPVAMMMMTAEALEHRLAAPAVSTLFKPISDPY
jgi:hypothetical protein